MSVSDIIMNIDNILWATPLIALTFGGAVIFCFAIKFANVTKMKLQLKLLLSGEDSEEGLSPYQTFSTVVAYRVAIGNVGGVMVAIMSGGPGAILWMIITALVTSAISYAENSLGQIYKIRMDKQYRGGPYFYMQYGIPWKKLGNFMAKAFAGICAIVVPFLVTGPSANNIGMAWQNTFGIPNWVAGLIIAILLFLVISGGIRRIADVATIIVPIMTVLYLVITIAVLVGHASNIGPAIKLICTSAFNGSAIFGGMMGAAFNYGVKRAVNSSGSGFGETPAAAAAAETNHPATQGLVNAFSVYIDVLVCFCSGIMAVVSGCYNVLAPGSSTKFMFIGNGSSVMKAQAASHTAGVVWVQEAANSVWPQIGGFIIALSITFFAFSTCIAYYYEGESAIAYLFHENDDSKTRKVLIWAIRIIMPITFTIWSFMSASNMWAISEIGFALMAWLNLITLLILLPVVKKVYDDYMYQVKMGIEKPFFNPKKLGLKNMDLWMDINKDLIEAEEKGGVTEVNKLEEAQAAAK